MIGNCAIPDRKIGLGRSRGRRRRKNGRRGQKDKGRKKRAKKIFYMFTPPVCLQFQDGADTGVGNLTQTLEQNRQIWHMSRISPATVSVRASPSSSVLAKRDLLLDVVAGGCARSPASRCSRRNWRCWHFFLARSLSSWRLGRWLGSLIAQLCL
jgi:hypothetical protein